METKNDNTTTASNRINTVIMAKDEFETLSSKKSSDSKSTLIRTFTVSNLIELNCIDANSDVYFYRPAYNLSSFGFAVVDQQFFGYFKFLAPNIIFISYLNITIDVLIVINYDKDYAGWESCHNLTIKQLFHDNAFSIDVYYKSNNFNNRVETVMNDAIEKKSNECVVPVTDNQKVSDKSVGDNRNHRIELLNQAIDMINKLDLSDYVSQYSHFNSIKQLTAERNELIRKDDFKSCEFDQNLPLSIIESNNRCVICGEEIDYTSELNINLSIDDAESCFDLDNILQYGISIDNKVLILHCCGNKHVSERDTLIFAITTRKLTVNKILDLRESFKDC